MFLRVLIWSLIFYFVARVAWKIISAILGQSSREPSGTKPEETPQKPTEEFKDVRDAKFIDVPKTPPQDSGNNS